MENITFERNYASTFRDEDVKKLLDLISKRISVELVGMKRVGINNFLRFFLYHSKPNPSSNHNLLILVDLNDLIELELFSFWRLTLKRIVDNVENSKISSVLKEKISGIFLKCIQSGDFFLTFDGVKEIISYLSKNDIAVTLFLTRFDRIEDSVSLEFFHNLQSLKDAGMGKLSFVFTSFRSLSEMAPHVFDKNSLTLFSKIQYIKPALENDSYIMLESFLTSHKLKVNDDIKKLIVELSGGHAQYLQISVVILSEIFVKRLKVSSSVLQKMILEDERITLLSEELWESLNSEEKNILNIIISKKRTSKEEREKNVYLWECGFLNSKSKIFSPLFMNYIEKNGAEKNGQSFEFSKKEFLLYSLLQKSPNEICERENIVNYVWPEYQEYGVSDWSIDRLVARVRNKLKKQESKDEIITVRTRGYKLITNNPTNK